MANLAFRWISDDTSLASLASLKALDERESSGQDVDLPSALRMLQDYRDGGATFVVADMDNYTVGFGIGTENGRSYFLNKTYVLPGFRGKGIGTAIEREQAARAKGLGLKDMVSYVAWENQESLALQRKMGMKVLMSNLGGCYFSIQL